MKSFHNVLEEEINEEYEYELENKLTDIDVKNKIEKILDIKNISEIFKYSIEVRNEKIRELNILKGVSKVQISRVLGMNKRLVQKIMEK